MLNDRGEHTEQGQIKLGQSAEANIRRQTLHALHLATQCTWLKETRLRNHVPYNQ